MEDLTEPMQKAVEKEELVQFRDPRNERIYVLVRQDEYNRFLENSEGIPPGVLQAKEAFLKDLPSLLKNPKYDRWCAAYCGAERIGIAPSEKDLVRECHQRGLKSGQYFIWVIAPHASEIEDIDPSLYEFEPIDS
jgi:hypothetical protein